MTQGKNFLDLSSLKKESIKFILCDIDDTLTNEGKLFSEAYDSLWRLHRSGFKIIPITGRPAGWCEMIARIWPVDGIVGENGAFYFYYQNQQMKRYFTQTEITREQNKIKLISLRDEILKKVSGAAVASDQFCRVADLAIDFCEDVSPLPSDKIQEIVKIFKKNGAEAKVSSIHVNGWFGEHDKLTTTLKFLSDLWNITTKSKLQTEVLFIGDSPNDEPMFKFFQNSVGVKNIQKYLGSLEHPPKYICSKEGGLGFQELADYILK